MKFLQYKELFEQILNSPKPVSPYDDEHFFNYTKLNWSRMNRWLKTIQLSEDQKEKIKQIKTHQKWLVITEPWCGDAAHIVPIIYLFSTINSNIDLDFVLRDEGNNLIESYLTNGTKSIPKLIIRDEIEKDLSVWGPRPEKAADLVHQLKAKNIPVDELKIELQNWYNADKGQEIINELLNLILEEVA